MSHSVKQRDAKHPVDPDFDPLDESFIANPYPHFARFRREAPIFYAPKIGFWVVSRYEDILKIVKDSDAYSSRQGAGADAASNAGGDAEAQGRSPRSTHGLDSRPAQPSPHPRVRLKGLLGERVAFVEPIIRETANDLIDQFIKDGRADLVGQFAFPLPAQTILRMVGIPEEDIEAIKKWCYDRLKVSFGCQTPEEQMLAVDRMTQLFGYLENFVEERAKEPRDDYTSGLLRIAAEEDSDLKVEEIVSMIYSLSFAGHETTTNLIANGLRQILSRPGLWELLREDPSLLENTVEEMLRFDSSVIAWRRMTKKTVEIAGVEVPEGARIFLLLGSANHDESVFEGPEKFDIHRENANKHIAFSHGIHFCLGAPLARLETRIALELLTRRLPDLRLAPADQRFEFAANAQFRGPTKLWADWSPTRAKAEAIR